MSAGFLQIMILEVFSKSGLASLAVLKVSADFGHLRLMKGDRTSRPFPVKCQLILILIESFSESEILVYSRS